MPITLNGDGVITVGDSTINSTSITTGDGFSTTTSLDYQVGKIVHEVSSDNWSHASDTTWKEWPTAGFSNHTGFTGGSKLHIEYFIPTRHDGSYWGGGYIDVNITFDNGVAWRSAGNSGYDAGVMIDGGSAIHAETRTIFITNTPSEDYSVKLRFMAKRYNGGTFLINQSHDINRTATAGFCPAGSDGVADTRLAGLDSTQAYGSYRIIEFIPQSV